MTIEKKHLVTGALLAFVAVTAVTLAVKETSHARAVSAAEAARVSSPPAAVPEAPAPVATEVPEAAPASPPTAPAPVAPVAAPAARPEPLPAAPKDADRPARAAEAPVAATAAVPPSAGKPSTVFVTYFHTTARCMSCLKIEDLTASTMTTRFAAPIADKRIVWRSVNLDEPANNHFVKDYGLYTKSVVVSEVKDGREVRWKNLEKVWQLLGSPESFQAYVEKEVQGFLDPA